MGLDIFYYSNYNYSILFSWKGKVNMANYNNVRLIDALGRVALPVEVRDAMDWTEKTPVEIWANADEQKLVIKRHSFTCAFCGETEHLKVFGKKHICAICQSAIAAL